MAATIYIADNNGDQVLLEVDATSAVEYIDPGATGTWTWVAEKYGFKRLTGTFNPADGGINTASLNFVGDSSITQPVRAIVAAYTILNNLDQLYDYCAYHRTQYPKYNVITANAGLIYVTCDIVLDALAPTICSYDEATNTLTLKTNTLEQGVNNTFLSTTGTLTAVNSSKVTSLYATNVGKSARLNYSSLVSSSIYLSDNLAVAQDYQTNKTGSYTNYIQPGATGTWSWVVERYGYVRQNSSISLASGAGGDFSALINYATDINITQTNKSTTAAYSVISDLSQLFDYDAYWRTTQTGISHKLITPVGNVLDFGLTKIIIDNLAPDVYYYDEATDTVTIKSVVLAASSKFNSIKGKIVTIAPGSSVTAVYESDAGASSSILFNNLANSSVFIADDLNQQIDFQTGLTGSFVESLPPGKTGVWSWISTAYGKVRQANTFEPAAGGNFVAVTSLTTDFTVTESNPATVVAYAQFANLDEIYDYNNYWQTTNEGIHHNLFSNVGGNLISTADLVFDKTALALWSYNGLTNTLTVKADVIVAGVKNTKIQANNISFTNGSKATCLYTTSAGTSVNLVFKGLINSALYVGDNTNTLVEYQPDLTGQYTIYIAPGATGDWKWTAERYTFNRQAGLITPAQGGVITINLSWTGDSTAFVGDKTTVAAYTYLNDPQKVNDFEAYWRTTSDGISTADTVFRNADSLDFGSYSVVIDPTLPQAYDVINGIVYLRATNLVANVISTTGTVQLANGAKVTGVISDTTGTSSQLLINNLTGCSVAVFDDSNVIYDYKANITGSYDLSVPSDFSGDWSYVITKFNRIPITGTFSLGQSIATIVMYNEKVDARVVNTNLSSVSAYTALNSTQHMYDYFSYWATLEEGIPWHSVVNWSGSVLNCGAADLILDPNAVEVAHIDEISHIVTIRIDSAQLTGDLITTGLVTRLNGATTTGLVTDSTGTTAIVSFSGFTGSNKLYVEDDLGVQRLFTTVTTDEHILYLLPSEQTANDWSWAAKKTGYQHATSGFSVAGGGRIPIQVGMAIIEQPDGSNMFTTAGIPDTILVDWTTSGDNTPRINLGDLQYYIQDIYNAVDVAMSTLDGLRWIANGNSDVRIAILPAGNFIFLTTGWRFRCSVAGSSNASVNGFAISADAKSIDASNGPVSLLSASGALAESKIAELDYIYERIQLLPKLFDIETSTVLAKEATVDALPTLAEIEASAILAKEASVNDLPLLTEIEASTVLAKESSITALGTPLQADDYVIPDNTSISAIKVQTDKLVFTGDNLHTVAKLVEDKTGYELTASERANIATKVEQAILDENDGQAILEAIVGAIGNQNIDEIALVAAIRSDLERTGGSLDMIPVLSEIEASTVLAKQSAVTALPLLSDIEASTVLAKEATVSTLPTLSEIEASTILAMKTDIEAVPTLAEIEGSTVLAMKSDVNNLPSLADIEASTVLAKDASFDELPTLAEIEASTVIAKVTDIQSLPTLTEIEASTVLATKDDIAAVPTLSEIEASTVLAKEATVDNLPTLSDIESSTVLAKEQTVGELPTLAEIEASTVLAKESSLSGALDGIPTLTDIENSTVLAKQASIDNLPLLSDIEGSTILAKTTDVEALPTLTEIEASDVLAKEATITARPTLTEIEATTVLAKQSDVAALPTLTDIEESAILAKEQTLETLPTLSDIEGSTVLAKQSTLDTLPTLSEIEASTVLVTKTDIGSLPTLTDIEGSTVIAKEETAQAAFIAASNAPFV